MLPLFFSLRGFFKTNPLYQDLETHKVHFYFAPRENLMHACLSVGGLYMCVCVSVGFYVVSVSVKVLLWAFVMFDLARIACQNKFALVFVILCNITFFSLSVCTQVVLF